MLAPICMIQFPLSSSSCLKVISGTCKFDLFTLIRKPRSFGVQELSSSCSKDVCLWRLIIFQELC